MKYLLLIFLSLMVCRLQAQTPGYMGKKLAIYYEPKIFPSIVSTYDNGEKLGFNFRNDFAVDYTVSKSVVLGCSFKYITTQLKNVVYYANESDYYYDYVFSGNILLRGPVFSIYIKNFSYRNKGFLAPLGLYKKFEIIYGKVKASSGTTYMGNNPGFIYLDHFEKLGYENTRSIYGFIFSFGRQTLFFDRLFVNSGGSVGFTTGLTKFNGNSYGGRSHDFQDNVDARIGGYFLFNVDLGIGLLL